MNEFFVCYKHELQEGSRKRVVVDGEEIVLFNVNEEVCAVANICPHQKFQKLHEGEFCNGIVTCPMHGWAYDVRTGISTNADGKLKTYSVTIKKNRLFIVMPEL